MKRRRLLLAGASLLAVLAPALAQAAPRIAFLHPGTAKGNGAAFEAFRSALRQIGYSEGRNVSIRAYWAEDKTDRLEQLAAQAVADDPAVIVTASSSAIRACMKATERVPIIFATGSTPVEQGFVASLRRPGGNVTGIIFHQDLEAKIVEVVKEALPSARRLGVLVHEHDAVYRIHLALIEPAAKRLGMSIAVARISGAEDFERAFATLAAGKADALVLPSQVLFSSRSDQLSTLALKWRIAMFGAHSSTAEAGGLISYGTLTEENYRRAAAMVDKILKGVKPGELPVEQPERIQLVVNLKTSRALGIKLPPALILRADEVIE